MAQMASKLGRVLGVRLQQFLMRSAAGQLCGISGVTPFSIDLITSSLVSPVYGCWLKVNISQRRTPKAQMSVWVENFP